ncbi:MAG: hypothetical protein CMI09_16050 [Oceanospirillaceae bacterium]|nr:hypothetical protein [Oceanospirillaceae bacterium]
MSSQLTIRNQHPMLDRCALLSICRYGISLATAITLQTAQAEITVNDSRSDYAVHAANAVDLSLALKNTNRLREGGMIEVALTTSRLSAQMSAKGHESGCRIDRVHITADVNIRMPTLQTSSPFLQAQWDYYYPHLLEHEMQHRAITLATAEQMEREILALPDQNTCDDMMADADATFKRLHQDGQRQQQLFDEAEYASGRLDLNNFFRPEQRSGQ